MRSLRPDEWFKLEGTSGGHLVQPMGSRKPPGPDIVLQHLLKVFFPDIQPH